MKKENAEKRCNMMVIEHLILEKELINSISNLISRDWESFEIKSRIEQLFKQYKQVLHEMKNCGNWENTVVEFRLSSILKEE